MNSNESAGHPIDDVPRLASLAPVRRFLPIAATALALIVIGIATLRAGDATESRAACFICAPSGSRVGVDLILNVLLFVPYGAGLRAMRLGWPRALAAVVVTTLLIELLQFEIVPGRYSSIADVATNTFGGVMGIALAHRWRGLILPAPLGARRLALAGLAGWLGLIVASAIAATPSFPRGAYVVRWRPDSGSSVPGEGKILTAHADGAPLRSNLRSADGPNPDGVQLGEPTRLDATLVASEGAGRDVRLEIQTSNRRSRVVLGQNERDLILRVHLRASDARLRGPTLRITNALASTLGSPADDTVAVTGEISRRRLHLQSIVNGQRMERELRLGPHLGWSFLIPGRTSLPPLVRALADALWLGFLLVPAAYWARRSLADGDRVVRRRELRIVLAGGLLFLVIGLAVVPAILRVGAVPALGWPVAIACALAGWATGATVSRRALARGTR